VNEVRRRGSIWLGIVVVVVFFACVTFAVASLGGGPGIPHRVGGEVAACTTCHPVDRLPRDHQDRTGDGCRSCHSPAPAE
jgi:hypothetical protein